MRRRFPLRTLAVAVIASVLLGVSVLASGTVGSVKAASAQGHESERPTTLAEKRAAAKRAAAKRAAAKRAAAKKAAARRAAAKRAAAKRKAAAARKAASHTAVVARGRLLFKQNCSHCHALTAAGAYGKVGPDLNGASLSFADARYTIVNGNSLMPGFGATLTPAQINDLATFVSEATH